MTDLEKLLDAVSEVLRMDELQLLNARKTGWKYLREGYDRMKNAPKVQAKEDIDDDLFGEA